jgi:hypothetical protein
MANYVKATNFYTKDALLTGNPAKIIKGAEIDAEYNAIAIAVNSKADTTSPTFTGSPQTPTATAGNNSAQIASTSFVTTALNLITDSMGDMANQDADAVDITGGTIVGITDLSPADGGTGASTLAKNALLVGNDTSAVTSIRPSTNGNLLTSIAGGTVSAGSFVVGTQYTILTAGTTSFTSIGAANNTVGTVFTATGVGSGTGTATTNTWASVTPVGMGLGYGQTWQNVAGSRANGTTYTNSTGKPIMVGLTVIGTGTITVDGVVAAMSGVNNATNYLGTIVPNGSSYIVAGWASSYWAELR